MGQYREWLHFREVDQQLQAKLETLEKELAQLQERAQCLAQHLQPPYYLPSGQDASPMLTSPPGSVPTLDKAGQANNQIIHALAVSLNGQLISPHRGVINHAPTQSTPPAQPGPSSEIVAHEPIETMSSAFFARSNLPNFGPQEMPMETGDTYPPDRVPLPDSPQQHANSPHSPPSIPHSDMPLLPEDMATFFDQHAQTDPQIELPGWLRNITDAAGANHPDGPIDQESMRTNRLVQRWVERWRRQVMNQRKSGRTNDE